MQTIKIDDEVYALLASHVQGFETPNAVLRRLLLDPKTAVPPRQPAPIAPVAPSRGKLRALLDAGVVTVGDELEHHRMRSGITYRATVGAGGTVITDLGEFDSPSPALRQLVGTEIDGWANWKHVKSGQALRSLRNGLLANE